MAKDINVLVVEEDPYSRDMITMLLTRDWRTRVVGELRSYDLISDFLAQPLQPLDIILIGMETLGDQTWPLRVIDDILILSDPPVVLIAGTNLESSIVKYLIKPNFGGFLLKREVAYSIASAVALTYQGNVVITPGVSNIAVCKESTRPVVIVDGSHKVANFSRRESEIIHLGILFNLSQRDLADELLIGTDWISETMSNVYEKLGLREILNGEVPLNLYFEDEVVITHFERILERAKKSSKTGKFRKAPWMSTLAFHLLTVPEIDKF